MMISNGELPAWKKELILRRRNKCAATGQLQASSASPGASQTPPFFSSSSSPPSSSCCSTSSTSLSKGFTVQQPSATTWFTSSGSTGVRTSTCTSFCSTRRCNKTETTMVQERSRLNRNQIIEEIDGKNDGSEEELRYGPGIVNKLKNRYLSLTLREASNRTRPSLLNVRKATSLEHILDDIDNEEDAQHHNNYHKNDDGKKHVPKRFQTSKADIKRSRSVETISTSENVHEEVKPKRESFHEDALANRKDADDKKTMEINDIKTFSSDIALRLNRPKRLAPLLNEKEKPPADLVKQTLKVFEKPELRTKPPHHTGEVAAKVAYFRESFETKKPHKQIVAPPIKSKPNVKTQKPKQAAKSCKADEKKKKPPPPTVPTNIPLLRSPIKQNSREFPLLRSPTRQVDEDHQVGSPSKLIELITQEEIRIESLPTSSPIPDISKLEFHERETTSSLTETPDLIVSSLTSPTESFKVHDSTTKSSNNDPTKKSNDFITNAMTNGSSGHADSDVDDDELDGPKEVKVKPNQKLGNSMVFDFSTTPTIPNHLPLSKPPKSVRLKRSNPVTSPKGSIKHNKVPITEPLKIEIIEKDNMKTTTTPPMETSPIKISPVETSPIRTPPVKTSPIKTSPVKTSPTKTSPVKNSPVKNGNDISVIVLEKNFRNETKTLEVERKDDVKRNGVDIVISPQKPAVTDLKRTEKPKAEMTKLEDTVTSDVPLNMIVKKSGNRSRQQQEPQNCLVFNFTSRKDVPDYVGNDGRIKTGKIERPKPGEGGITILAGATLDESLIDDDDDWKLSLEGPPSPLTVTFINDNILIDGRSSLSQKLRKPKMTIKFVEAAPDIFEYPPESSLLFEEVHQPLNSNSVGHTFPTLSGSSFANYTPKTSFQIDEFQLGVRPTSQPEVPPKTGQVTTKEEEDEGFEPVAFSAGTNSDILF